MVGRNRSPARSLQRFGGRGLDAKADRGQTRLPQRLQQFSVKSIEPGFAFETQPEASRPNLIAQRKAAVAIFGEERIPKHDVGLAFDPTQIFELVNDVRGRPVAVPGKNPVRAIRTELRATAAGQQGKRSSCGTAGEWYRHPAAGARANQIPAGKWKCREVLDRRALHPAGQGLPRGKSRDRVFRFADDDEVSVVLEQFGQLRRGETDEAGSQAAGTLFLGPGALATIVDERGKHNCGVAVD